MAFGHGKLILLGEHSVVYGRPAIAVALPQGAEAHAEAADRARLEVQPWGVVVDAAIAEPDPQREMLRQAFAALLAGFQQPPAVAVRARLALPVGAGLGGSAALSVAIVRAIDEHLGKYRSAPEVASHALAAERVFHGNPSGIDTSVAASGRAVLYRKGHPLEALSLRHTLNLVVGDTGSASSTRDTVASVARQHAQNPAKIEEIFDGIEALVVNARSALQAGESSRLGQLMSLNQKLLSTMLLSTSQLEEMCQAAERAGALGAKLTGGGGGGCMIALVEHAPQAAAIVAALEALGRRAFPVEVGG
jgi:mevalonate kinase